MILLKYGSGENSSQRTALTPHEKFEDMSKRFRLKLVLTLGAIAFLLAVGYERLFLARPVGTGPAGPTVDLQAFQSHWTDRQVKLVGLGDSVTAGLGASHSSLTYFNRLSENPTSEFEDMKGRSLRVVLPSLTLQNLAVSGSRSIAHETVIDERLPMHSEDVFGLVVMTSGGNDLIHSYGRQPPRENAMFGATLEQAQPWIQSFEGRLIRMFEKITTRFPGGCEIYIADIYDPTDGVGDGASIYLPAWPDGLEIHRRYNEVIRKVASTNENVFVVPMHEAFLGHGSHCRQFWRENYDRTDPHYWYYTNIEDPNDRGYDAIRRLFLNSIVEHSSLRHGL